MIYIITNTLAFALIFLFYKAIRGVKHPEQKLLTNDISNVMQLSPRQSEKIIFKDIKIVAVAKRGKKAMLSYVKRNKHIPILFYKYGYAERKHI